MLLKAADDKSSAIEMLQQFLERPDLTAMQKKAISKEIAIMRAGIKGEKEASYEIDFYLKDSKNYILLHDLRFEVNDRVAQIDHLIIDRTLQVYVLETKHFSSGIKINDFGEFSSWNHYQKRYEGIPSPIAQNERHISVLKDVFSTLSMPKRLGITLKPKMLSYILLSKNARIERPEKLDSHSVIKCDAFYEVMMSSLGKMSVAETFMSAAETFGSLGKIISRETLQGIGRQLKHSHKPITINYAAKFGLSEVVAVTPPEAPEVVAKPVDLKPQATTHSCSKCSSNNTSIVSGKFGYYFKCADCEGNTAIKLKCATDECKPRIRKQGLRFFEECENCGSSKLYHVNVQVSPVS